MNTKHIRPLLLQMMTKTRCYLQQQLHESLYKNNFIPKYCAKTVDPKEVPSSQDNAVSVSRSLRGGGRGN